MWGESEGGAQGGRGGERCGDLNKQASRIDVVIFFFKQKTAYEIGL